MKIVLGGPPNSGKGCLRQRLKRVLSEDHRIYAYALTVHPDGDGAWFQETAAIDPKLALRLKRAHRRPWSEERARLYAEWVRNCEVSPTLVDIGGVPDRWNEMICAAATHLIILAPAEGDFPPWRMFGRTLGLQLLGEMVSDYEGTCDMIDDSGVDGVLRGRIHRLERGELTGRREAVDALARRIVGELGERT